MDKKVIMFGMFVGSIIGGYIPVLWGAGAFSFTSILFASVGAVVGIWVSYKLLN